jgi:hypothetical protein
MEYHFQIFFQNIPKPYCNLARAVEIRDSQTIARNLQFLASRTATAQGFKTFYSCNYKKFHNNLGYLSLAALSSY